MPQKGGRPKGAARCHPRTIEIKLPAAMRDASAWRERAALSIDGAVAFLEAAARGESWTDDEHATRWAEELPGPMDAAHLLIDAGVEPARMLQVLKQLKEKLVTANFDREGNITLRASTARGARGEASSQELAQALTLLPGSYDLFYSGGPDLFAAAAPTAESYADMVLSIPELESKATALPRRAEAYFAAQESLLNMFSAGEIDLTELHRRDTENRLRVKQEHAADAGEIRAALARLPGGTPQRRDLLELLEIYEKEAHWYLVPLFESDDVQDVIKDAAAWSELRKAAESREAEAGTGSEGAGSEEDDDDDLYYLSSPLTSRGSRRPPLADENAEVDEKTVRDYIDTLWTEIHWESQYGLRRDSDSLISFPGGHTGHGDLLPLIDGYVRHLQPPGLEGNEASSRRMARAMLEAVRHSDDLLRYYTESGHTRDWSSEEEGSGEDSDADAYTKAYRAEQRRRHRDDDFFHTHAPYIHDRKGPYRGVAPTPVIIALAPYLDDKGALELSGAMRLGDGWEEEAARALQDAYDVTPKVARAHVQAAAAKLLPTDVPDGEDLRIVGQVRRYAGFGNRRLLARLAGGELLEAVNEVAPDENGLEQLMVTLRIDGKPVASEPGAGLEDVVRRYAAERRAAGA